MAERNKEYQKYLRKGALSHLADCGFAQKGPYVTMLNGEVHHTLGFNLKHEEGEISSVYWEYSMFSPEWHALMHTDLKPDLCFTSPTGFDPVSRMCHENGLICSPTFYIFDQRSCYNQGSFVGHAVRSLCADLWGEIDTTDKLVAWADQNRDLLKLMPEAVDYYLLCWYGKTPREELPEWIEHQERRGQ